MTRAARPAVTLQAGALREGAWEGGGNGQETGARGPARGLALPVLCVGVLVLILGKVGLPLPHVPVQTLGQAPEPVAHRVPHADGRQRVAGGSDADAGGRHGR